jgi:hypothetical protein
MLRKILTVPALAIVAVMYMAITLGLVRLTLMIAEVPSFATRALARAGELGAGIIVLLGGTFIATRLAVWLFDPATGSSR